MAVKVTICVCLGNTSSGVHHQVLAELGLVPINRVTAEAKGARAPSRAEGRRVEKTVHVEDKVVRLSDDSRVTVHLYARAGAIGLGELTEVGELSFLELRRIRTHRIRNKRSGASRRDTSGGYRWYNDHALPPRLGSGVVTVRLHGTQQDRRRRFNRTENVRPIPQSDPDFNRLYGRRNDAESINRGVVDSMYLGRAHSLGHARQQVNLLGYALMMNSVTLHAFHQRAGPLRAVA